MTLVVILGLLLTSHSTFLAWLVTSSFEILHSVELLVLFDDALHCGHWHLKLLGYGFVAFPLLVTSHNA